MKLKEILTLILAMFTLTISVSVHSLTKDDVDKLYDDENYDAIITHANKGNKEAQNILGTMYSEGIHVKQSSTKSFEWYLKAAKQGLATAQFNVAANYMHGNGVDSDQNKAAEWNLKAANQGFAKAQFNMGYNYHFGQGVKLDYTKAFEWYQKAADQGVARAFTNIAILYIDGNGVEKDVIKGNEWYLKAANQGEPVGQASLGVSYNIGRGLKQNWVIANEWLQKSADQGYAYAQYHLAVNYLEGNGIELSKQEYAKSKGMALLKKAADQGFEEAQEKLSNINLAIQSKDIAKKNAHITSTTKSYNRTSSIKARSSIQVLYQEKGVLTDDEVTLDKNQNICTVSSIYSRDSSNSVLPASLEIIYTKSTGKKTYKVYVLKTDLSDIVSITQDQKNLEFKHDQYSLIFNNVIDTTIGNFSLLAEKKNFTFIKLRGHYPNDEALEVFERCINRLKK